MFHQALRFLFSFINAYSFYKNPVQFLVITAVSTALPILIYAIGGIFAFLFLLILIGYFIYKAISNNSKKEPSI